jgi:hypothetical protein
VRLKRTLNVALEGLGLVRKVVARETSNDSNDNAQHDVVVAGVIERALKSRLATRAHGKCDIENDVRDHKADEDVLPVPHFVFFFVRWLLNINKDFLLTKNKNHWRVY